MKLKQKYTYLSMVLSLLCVAACTEVVKFDAQTDAQIEDARSKGKTSADYYGTKLPFASEAVYFVMTDRFVDGDPLNNHEDQGGDYPTFNLPLIGDDGLSANVGYMGGDLLGVLNNGQYIADMGFSAVWLTPIVDNPDQAFAGGEAITFGGAFKDGGKTGYHGYWASNFYQIDEHYPSAGLSYKEYTAQMRDKFALKSVFDIVANHGSPSFTMPVDQAKFGELYDIDGKLLADHQNLQPKELDSNNPLHQFFHHETDIMQLSNFNEQDSQLQDYLINSYLYWIEQGADAFRIDTIKHVPHTFWKLMSDRIRAKYPDFYMFSESYDYDANFIAQHTLAENGGISVLDFPGQQAMNKVFTDPESDFAQLISYLHLRDGPYANPYELATFYDNHDMARMNASDEGFIDANNWLFTSRGIPVVYQGSELGFMRGLAEHQGNRNYLGQDNIERAKQHAIHHALSHIANVRKSTPALQRGLQLNVQLAGHKAVFYRVLQHEGVAQTALVLLNKGNAAADFSVSQYMQAGRWSSLLSDDSVKLNEDNLVLESQVPAHGVQVWLREGQISNAEMLAQLDKLMLNK